MRQSKDEFSRRVESNDSTRFLFGILNAYIINVMKKILILTYFFISLIGSAFAAELSIELKSSAQVADSSIKVKDIASIKGDKEMAEQLANCVIASSPLIGYKKSIAQDYFRLRLKQQKIDLSTLEITGSDEVVISRRSKLITGKELFENCKELVLMQLPWEKEDIALATYRAANDVLVPEAQIDYEVELISEPVSGRRLNVEITIIADGEEFVKVPMALKLSRFVEVVVSRRTISRGEIVNAADLYLSREEMGHKIANAFTAIEDVNGKQAVSMIKENHVLVSRMVAMPLVIKRREVATLLYEKNNLYIRTKVQARENGRVGDIIRVQNPETKKEFLAQVIAKGELRYAL